MTLEPNQQNESDIVPTPPRPLNPPFVRTLEEGIRVLENAGVPYVVGGGLAARAYGRRRLTKDIDVFVTPEGAEQALEAFAKEGFRTERTDPDWLYKAFKRDVLVDIIFRSSGDILIDEETLTRAGEMSIAGHRIKVLPPEDLVIMKIMAIRAESPRHWRDALAILHGAKLDWDYLLKRAIVGPKRVLSLLLFAQTEGIVVPDWVLQELASMMGNPQLLSAKRPTKRSA